ncbi:MAG TPA: PEP-CTERM sorting domain-containing protein [Fimbriimonadaceae bacterium]|nr:PEP-CTERM sorting domain-containing protein [Fimbriimonadaceae bacterium]
MKKTLLCALGLLAVASAFAQTTVYDSTVGITGVAFAIGGATVVGSNTITSLAADDVTMTNLGSGMDIVAMQFAVANFDSVDVTFRPKVRMWLNDGALGAPGTYYNNPTAVDYTFSPITVAAGFINVLGASIPAGLMTIPSGTIWVGIQFDNNNGTTGATAANLNNLGVVINSPTVGSSADEIFASDTPASDLFNVANPSGLIGDFGGVPKADLVWRFDAQAPVPEPASMVVLGAGLAFVASRRRRRKAA